MRYFNGLFLASEPRVEVHLSGLSWISPCRPEDTLVLLEVLIFPAPSAPEAGVRGMGERIKQS